MPTYSYRCQLGHTFEITHGMTESPRVRCWLCTTRAHKIITSFPYCAMKWKAADAKDQGLRQALHAAESGVSSPLSQDGIPARAVRISGQPKTETPETGRVFRGIKA